MVQLALVHMPAAITLVSIAHMLAASALRSKRDGGTVMSRMFSLGVGDWCLVDNQGIVIAKVSSSLQREA